MAPATTPLIESHNSGRGLFGLAAIIIFVHFARPFDTILVGYKIPAIICSIGILAVIFAGGLKELQSNVGRAFIPMFGWMCISVPLSYWKGGSFMYVLGFLQLLVPLMLIVAAASRTIRDLMKLCGILAFSLLCHLALNKTEMGGRLALNGLFGNPDDVALLAGFTIPFVVLICTRLKNPVFRYGTLLGGIFYLLLLIGRTATRAAIPALIGMLAVYFFRSKGMQKALIVILALAGVAIAAVTLPARTLTRLSTVLDAIEGPSDTESSQGLDEAQGSAAERHELMVDALMTAIHHPLTGIGAGMFTQYRFDVVLRPDGKHKPYLPAHNTYLEIASESGVPGLIFYLVFLGSIFWSIRSTRKLSAALPAAVSEPILAIGLCLEAALVYFAICATFMTCDKHAHQFVVAGFAIALQRITAAALNGLRVTAQPVGLTKAPIRRVRDTSYPAWAR